MAGKHLVAHNQDMLPPKALYSKLGNRPLSSGPQPGTGYPGASGQAEIEAGAEGQARARGWGLAGGLRVEGGQEEARGGLGWFAAGRGAGPVKSGYLCESITRAQNCISGHTSFGGTGALQRPEGPMATDPWPLRVNAEGKPRRLSFTG